MKKISIVLLCVALLLVSVSFAASKFSDVAGTKYESAVEDLVSKGVINGFEDNTFRPNENVTRAQFAKMLVVALNMKALDDKPLTKVSDVSDTHWGYSYIKIAVDNGLISGYEDGTFKPDNNVTYAESMAMLIRAMGQEKYMADKTWPTGYINEATNIGLLKNVDYKEPNNLANRGDTAISIYNFLNVKNDKKEEDTTIVPKSWNGNYINNVDGYMSLSIKEIDSNSFEFSFVGYKNGGFKGGNNTATIRDGKGIYESTFFGDEYSLTFSYDGKNIIVTTQGEKCAAFAGTYKVDDGSIKEIEFSNPNRISAVYSDGSLNVTLEETTNNKMIFSVSGTKNGGMIYIGGRTLDYSNGVASLEEEFIGDIEKIKITVEAEQITIEASSTNPDDVINKINGVYKFKNKTSNSLEDYKNQTKGFSVGKGVFMF